MTRTVTTRLAGFGVLLLTLTLPTTVFAALGGDVASVDAGAHFDRYQTVMRDARRARTARGSVLIDLPDLVVQMSGHPRSFFGRVYVPALMPQGVRVESIQ